MRVFVCSLGMGILVATDTRRPAHPTSTNLQRKGCVSQTSTPPVQYAALPGESELEVLHVQCIYVRICMTVCMYVYRPTCFEYLDEHDKSVFLIRCMHILLVLLK